MKAHFAQPFRWVVGIGGLLGLLFGLAAGWTGSVLLTRAYVESASRQYIRYIAGMSDEVEVALAQMPTSTFPACSDGDLGYLNRLVIASQYLKGLARQRGDEVICTTLAGRPAHPVPRSKPDYVSAAGQRVLLNFEPIGVPGALGIVFGTDDVSAMVSMGTLNAPIDPGIAYVLYGRTSDNRFFPIKSQGAQARILGELPSSTIAPQLRRAGYEFSCSADRSTCVAARLMLPVDPTRLAFIAGLGLLGLISGSALAFGVSAAHARGRSLPGSLRRALAAGQISLRYQPVVTLRDRRTVGFEALACWHLSDGQSIPPDLFVAIAEQEGFIHELTRYVTNLALAETAEFLRMYPALTITINVSATDLLDPRFLTFINRQCQQRGLAPSRIGFELTERLTASIEELRTNINQLRAAGYALYVDDFGVEYSNLSYLADLQVDGLKLDKHFVSEVGETRKADIIVAQLAAMAEQLQMPIVIEGVETEAQAALLAGLPGDVRAQGWLFGKPVIATELRP